MIYLYYLCKILCAGIMTWSLLRYNLVFQPNQNKKTIYHCFGFFAVSALVRCLHIPDGLFLALIFLFVLILCEVCQRDSVTAFFSAVIFVCLYTMISFLFVFISGKYNLGLFTPFRFNALIGMMLVQTCLFHCVDILTVAGAKWRNETLPRSVIFSKVITSLSILFLLLFPLFFTQPTDRPLFVAALFFLLAINVFAQSYADRTKHYLTANAEREIFAYRNKLYESQLTLIKNSAENVRRIKHDISNHLTTISALLSEHRTEEALAYTNTLTSSLAEKKQWSKTGNIAADSILNYKLNTATEKQIQINCHIACPEDLAVDPVDLTVILGNLLDNAIEAAEHMAESNRQISLHLTYDKGRLFLKIENTFDGTVKKQGNGFVSKKKDGQWCGLGLQNVQTAITKYNGTMDITHTENRFLVKLLLFC